MKLLIISGGMYHPYVVTTPIIEDFLKAAGHDVSVTEDASILGNPADMNSYDALVFNTQRDNSLRFNHGPFTWSENEQVGIKDFISSGKGLVCLHIACYLPYNWLEYHDITGGGWIDGKSFHPPYGKVAVNVSDRKHPGVHGVADFTTYDELYMGLAFRDGNDVFITGTSEDFPGGSAPLGWTRKYGDGKVFVLLLGHDGQSCQTAEFQKIVLNGVGLGHWWVNQRKPATSPGDGDVWSGELPRPRVRTRAPARASNVRRRPWGGSAPIPIGLPRPPGNAARGNWVGVPGCSGLIS